MADMRGQDDAREITEEVLTRISAGAGPDVQGKYLCPFCHDYALRKNAEGTYSCGSCGQTFDYHF